MKDDSFSWLIGGPQGSGVDSSANIMARALASSGLWVFGKREYHSNIMGLHSYFQVRASGREVRSHVDRVDLLATFEEETLVRHADAVADGGGIIYDPHKAGTKIEEIETLHNEEGERVRLRLRNAGIPETVEGVLKEASNRSVSLYPVPYADLLNELVSRHPEMQLSKVTRMVNVVAVSASLALVGFDKSVLAGAIRSTFRGKPQVAELNSELADLSYDFVRTHAGAGFGRVLKAGQATEKRLLLMGNQAVAIGKILGGLRFQTYYPITPASDESEFLEANERFSLVPDVGSRDRKASMVVVQTEDEIAAITMATGAALTGSRAATSTSGPGFSLMCEGLGWAGINEVPVVVTLYQRAGPSTGMPTRHEQGDLRFALHAGQGEFPRIVLASGDMDECIYDAARAFDYADRYQLPVIHLVDKALANSNALVTIPDATRIRIDRGKLVAPAGDGGTAGTKYRRFAFTDDGVSPRAPLGSRDTVFWNTGDEHNEFGHIDEDPETRVRMMDKRFAKLDLADREIPMADRVNLFGPKDAAATVVSWGSTKGALLDAMSSLAEDGVALNFLQVRMLLPFPTAYVAEVLSRARRRIAVEMNYSSQLAGVIAEKTRIGMDTLLVKYNGRPMAHDELYEALNRAVSPSAPRRTVMMGGS